MKQSDEKKPKYKNNLIFDYLKNILQTKSKELYLSHINAPEFYSSFSSYMIVRYLSMHTSPAVRNVILENQRVLDHFGEADLLYKFLMDAIPRQSSSFITYLK